MSAQLNHTIVWRHQKEASAQFLADMLDRPAPTRFGPFCVVDMDNGVSLDFHDVEASREIVPQHYAFLISETDFDRVLGKIEAANLPHWADPARRRPGEINRNDGGRGGLLPRPGRPLPRGDHPAVRRRVEGAAAPSTVTPQW